jgi:cytidylate kinase
LNKKINIAIDGYSSCGKGTLAKMLAKSLGYIFIDSGAMYRAVTFAMLENKINPEDINRIQELLPKLEILFIHNPQSDFYHTCLNGVDIESKIRTMEVSQMVSPVSRINEVREFLVKQQKAMGLKKGVVMDGRDIGTVVFPDAELKIFMTARAEVRAQRRFQEMQSTGNTNYTFEEILANLNKRDAMDSSRANSPLKAAADAKIVDNSDMSREEQFELAFNMAKQILKS